MNDETRLRALEAINSLQFAVYALRDNDWDRARQLAQDVLLIIDATPARDKKLLGALVHDDGIKEIWT
jgi:hypothetical protein